MQSLLKGELEMEIPLHPKTKQPFRVYLENSEWCQQMTALTMACYQENSALPLWEHEKGQIAQGGTMEQWFLRRIRSYPHLTDDPDEADVIFLDAPLTLAAQLKVLYGQQHRGSCQQLIHFITAFDFHKMAIQRKQVFCANHPKVVLFLAFWGHLWPGLSRTYRFMAFSNFDSGKMRHNQFISVPSTSNAELVHAFLQDHCLASPMKRFDLFFMGSKRQNAGGVLRNLLSTIDWQREFPGSVVVVRDRAFVWLSAQEAAQQAAEYAEHISSARFCLIVAGDSPDSRRLFEAVLSGCVPILMSDWSAWLPFHWLPHLWTANTLIDLDVARLTPETLLPRLHQVIDNVSPRQLLHMQASLLHVLPDLLWGLGSPHADAPLFGRAADHALAEAVRRVREKPIPRYHLPECSLDENV